MILKCKSLAFFSDDLILINSFVTEGGPYHIETSSLVCSAYDTDLRHERFKLSKYAKTHFPAGIYLLEIIKKNTRRRCFPLDVFVDYFI